MKKFNLLATVVFVFLFTAFAQAEAKRTNAGRFMPDPQGYSSGAVYITTTTCDAIAGTTIAARPALLYAVNVTTPSENGGLVEIFDGGVSGQRSITNKIITTSVQPWIYDVGASSGLFMTKTGAACVSVIYLER